MQMDMERMLGRREVAAMVGVCRETIREWSQTEYFPSPRIDRPRLKRWLRIEVVRRMRERPVEGEVPGRGAMTEAARASRGERRAEHE